MLIHCFDLMVVRARLEVGLEISSGHKLGLRLEREVTEVGLGRYHIDDELPL